MCDHVAARETDIAALKKPVETFYVFSREPRLVRPSSDGAVLGGDGKHSKSWGTPSSGGRQKSLVVAFAYPFSRAI